MRRFLARRLLQSVPHCLPSCAAEVPHLYAWSCAAATETCLHAHVDKLPGVSHSGCALPQLVWAYQVVWEDHFVRLGQGLAPGHACGGGLLHAWPEAAACHVRTTVRAFATAGLQNSQQPGAPREYDRSAGAREARLLLTPLFPRAPESHLSASELGVTSVAMQAPSARTRALTAAGTLALARLSAAVGDQGVCCCWSQRLLLPQRHAAAESSGAERWCAGRQAPAVAGRRQARAAEWGARARAGGAQPRADARRPGRAAPPNWWAGRAGGAGRPHADARRAGGGGGRGRQAAGAAPAERVSEDAWARAVRRGASLGAAWQSGASVWSGAAPLRPFGQRPHAQQRCGVS